MLERRAIAIRGTVQGVGFRPFVFGLASRLKLAGFVRNSTGGVQIEVEGDRTQLNEFLGNLRSAPPPLARIEEISFESVAVRGETRFRIDVSVAEPGGVVSISPDVATCGDCLAEMFDPADRRYRYPFLNCTNCGPRLTIVTGAPYDRQRTTMAGFRMCPACRAEYDDPGNRRFHAQPTACPACGPRLWVADARGEPMDAADPPRTVVDALLNGRIAAIKGLGGYHLTCDASQPAVVAELRRRKHRDEKPFAVMAPDVAAAEMLCEISPAERELLTSWRRPIVLLREREQKQRAEEPVTRAVADGAAPWNPRLGVMLPYTPLHHLLLREIGGRPLVMTSGNRRDAPIAVGEPEVFERLAGIADVYLANDRPIHVRCDDSVTRTLSGYESPIRRSRGYAPQAIRLPLQSTAPGLAVGGQLKATFALLRGDRAVMSHHLGDLDHFEAYLAFEKDAALYERTFAIEPVWIAHDLHPDYASTRYALRRAAEERLTAIAVQHHHAHVASCMAEHGLDEPVIGVSFDGTGFGTDGAIWGGEFLIGDLRSFHRFAHLRYVPMPGADVAVREPWRMALAQLRDAGIDCPSWRARMEPVAARAAERMIARSFNAPLTSSMGRLFDAVASIIGVRDRVNFEGQAAMELEWLAETSPPDGCYSMELGGRAAGDCARPDLTAGSSLSGDGTTAAAPDSARDTGSIVSSESGFKLSSGTRMPEVVQVDPRPMMRAIVKEIASGVTPAVIARRFHDSLAACIVAVCARAREMSGIEKVVLSGGVFMNGLLAADCERQLKKSGFLPFQHRLVPANDGGLSLGQLAVAARQFEFSSKNLDSAT